MPPLPSIFRIAYAGQLAAGDAPVHDDLRASAAYRRQLIGPHAARPRKRADNTAVFGRGPARHVMNGLTAWQHRDGGASGFVTVWSAVKNFAKGPFDSKGREGLWKPVDVSEAPREHRRVIAG